MVGLVPLLLGIKWLDPAWLQGQYGGAFIWIALVIIFIECGLFFPFLPGDTLLFALGLFIAGGAATDFEVLGIGSQGMELTVSIVMLSLAALAGNVAGYEIGRKIGPPLYEHDGRILKKKYLDRTAAFFDAHGSKALVIGRFVPFVRTYVTVVAGITRMDRRRFVTWSAVGAGIWVVLITLLGYFLGTTVPWLAKNIDYVTLAILAFSVVPIGIEWLLRSRRHGGEGDTRTGDGGESAGAGRARSDAR